MALSSADGRLSPSLRLSDEEIERRVRNVGKAGIQRERETLKDRLDRLNAERDEALAQLQKIGKRRREE